MSESHDKESPFCKRSLNSGCGMSITCGFASCQEGRLEEAVKSAFLGSRVSWGEGSACRMRRFSLRPPGGWQGPLQRAREDRAMKARGWHSPSYVPPSVTGTLDEIVFAVIGKLLLFLVFWFCSFLVRAGNIPTRAFSACVRFLRLNSQAV